MVHVKYEPLCKCTFDRNTLTMSDTIAGVSCTAGDLSMNSKCYRKFDNLAGWFAASNDCFSFGGSLAVFSDLGRPSDNSQLTDWLAGFGTDKTYWIGLVNPWWMTVDEGDVFLNNKHFYHRQCLEK